MNTPNTQTKPGALALAYLVTHSDEAAYSRGSHTAETLAVLADLRALIAERDALKAANSTMSRKIARVMALLESYGYGHEDDAPQAIYMLERDGRERSDKAEADAERLAGALEDLRSGQTAEAGGLGGAYITASGDCLRRADAALAAHRAGGGK